MRRALLLLLVLTALASLGGAQVFFDHFDYPAGPTLGPWVLDRGKWQATGQAAQAEDLFLWQYLTRPNFLFQDCAAECTVTYNTQATQKLQFGGITLRCNGGATDTDLIMVKVQDNNSSGDFDSIWLYERPGGAVSTTSITPAFTKARVRLCALGNTAVASVDTNMDGVWDHVLTRTLTSTVKAGPIGVDGFGGVLIDDFVYFDAVIIDDPASPTPSPGNEVIFKIHGFMNGPFQAATALTHSGIPLYDGRIVPLGHDNVFLTSVTNALPMIFKNYNGILDSNGDAAIRLALPNLPALKGLNLYTAFVNYHTTGVLNISNDLQTTIQ